MKTLYLLTGAAGFLGSNICTQLLERGDSVRAFVLKGDPAAKYIPSGVVIFEGDLCSAEDCSRFFDVPEDTETICIHCASMVTVNPNYSEKLIAVNVGGTENIIAAAKSHPSFKKLVYVSSTGAIPELPKGQKIREVDQFVPYDDDKVVGWYSRSKAMATQKVLDAAKEGLNACVVHPSGILGPNDHAISETTGTIIKIMNGEMPVGMGGSFNLCDVRDLAYGTIAACDKGRQGECYILGNKEVTLKEVAKMLHDACGCKQPLFYVPIPMAYRLAAQMEKKAAKTGEKPLMTTFAVYNLDRNNAFDYSKAERELGYHTRSYAETLGDEARWLVAEGKIKGNVHVNDTVKETVSADEGLRTAMESRTLIRNTASAESEDVLNHILFTAGIKEYTPEALHNAYQALQLSRNAEELLSLFENSYGECCKRLAAYDMSLSPAEYDLAKDVISCTADKAMAQEMNTVREIPDAAETLKKYGYYHITEDFLSTLIHYANLMDQTGMFTEEDYRSMTGMNFRERVCANIHQLSAVGVIAALRFGLASAFEPAYLIAVAGGCTLIRQRFE